MWPTPPFSYVLKLVVELFLLKSVKFARYRRFGVFLFHGHFDPIAVFFLVFRDDLPPHFQVLWIQWCKNISLHYHHLEDMGGFDFWDSGWLSLYVKRIWRFSKACPFIFEGCDVNVGIFVKTSTSWHHIVYSTQLLGFWVTSQSGDPFVVVIFKCFHNTFTRCPRLSALFV